MKNNINIFVGCLSAAVLFLLFRKKSTGVDLSKVVIGSGSSSAAGGGFVPIKDGGSPSPVPVLDIRGGTVGTTPVPIMDTPAPTVLTVGSSIPVVFTADPSPIVGTISDGGSVYTGTTLLTGSGRFELYP